jgi:cyclopropane fatty-acyl-phospholipid synthase-like methyltransferase
MISISDKELPQTSCKTYGVLISTQILRGSELQALSEQHNAFSSIAHQYTHLRHICCSLINTINYWYKHWGQCIKQRFRQLSALS